MWFKSLLVILFFLPFSIEIKNQNFAIVKYANDSPTVGARVYIEGKLRNIILNEAVCDDYEFVFTIAEFQYNYNIINFKKFEQYLHNYNKCKKSEILSAALLLIQANRYVDLVTENINLEIIISTLLIGKKDEFFSPMIRHYIALLISKMNTKRENKIEIDDFISRKGYRETKKYLDKNFETKSAINFLNIYNDQLYTYLDGFYSEYVNEIIQKLNDYKYCGKSICTIDQKRDIFKEFELLEFVRAEGPR